MGNKIVAASKKEVPGSHKFASYGDTWQEEYDIEGPAVLSDPVIQQMIWDAFQASPLFQGRQSSYGALRWMNADTLGHIDVARRKLVVNKSCGMCD